MPYRNLEMVRGDIPRGGFLGSVVKSIGGAVKGAVGGLISGNPLKAITGAVGGAVRANVPSTMGGSGASMPIGSTPPPVYIAPGSGRLNESSPEELADLHRANVAKAQRAGAAGRPGAGMVLPGNTIAGALMGGPRKRPHMRVTNPKALRRALRRAEGFKKLALKTIRLVSPKTKGRFGGWKKSKRR